MTTILALAVIYSIAITFLVVVALGGNHNVVKELREERRSNDALRDENDDLRDENDSLRAINRAFIRGAELDDASPIYDRVSCEQLEAQFEEGDA